MSWDMVAETVAWMSFPLGAGLAGLSLAVAAYYLYNHHRNYPHIVCMAVSYSMLIVLMVLTVNYRIFYSGASRGIGALVMLLAFGLGLVGLWIIIKWRGKDMVHRTKG